MIYLYRAPLWTHAHNDNASAATILPIRKKFNLIFYDDTGNNNIMLTVSFIGRTGRASLPRRPKKADIHRVSCIQWHCTFNLYFIINLSRGKCITVRYTTVLYVRSGDLLSRGSFNVPMYFIIRFFFYQCIKLMRVRRRVFFFRKLHKFIIIGHVPHPCIIGTVHVFTACTLLYSIPYCCGADGARLVGAPWIFYYIIVFVVVIVF